MRLSLQLSIGASIILVAYACGGGPPPPPPGPDPDSLAREQARLDSIAAAEQARRDSIQRAQAERERLERMAADSVARERRITEEVRGMLEQMINFDYDQSSIRPGDAEILDTKLAILRANPNLQISISGHCDERGSDEYNLALGNRRAIAARQYLVDRGIDESRVSTNSFGEERPLDSRSSEDAWARNRRDEFSITAGGDRLVRPSGM